MPLLEETTEPGRVLTAEEIAHCVSRRYRLGYDDEHPQRSHICSLKSGETPEPADSEWAARHGAVSVTQWETHCGTTRLQGVLVPWGAMRNLIRCDECVRMLEQEVSLRITRV